MTFKPTVKRFLSLLLLLSIFLGILPAPVGALESLPEEKPTVKAGKDYTAVINNLEKPTISYGKHFDASNIETVNEHNWIYPFIPLGDYVLLAMVDGTAYAFAPRNLTGTPSTTVDSISLAIDAIGDYLPFASEEDVSDATITFRASTAEGYYYERLFVRQDGLIVLPGGSSNTPYFSAYSGNSNETLVFFNASGEDGMQLKKNIKYSGETTRIPHYLVYNEGNFNFHTRDVDPGRTENSLFYLYQMFKITENLYSAIQSAKTYATGNGDGKYNPELYAGFITLLEECIQVYGELNHYLSETELADVVALQDALDSRANSLNAYMQVLATAGSTPNYTTVLNKIPASRGWDNHVVDTTEKTDFRGWNGTYFIVGNSHLMDPTATPSVAGHIAAVPVTVENKRVTNAALSQAIDLFYEETADGSDSKSYFFRAQNGNYLRAEIVDGNPTLSWGHAHQPLVMGYIRDNLDRERVYFSRNVNYDLNGNSLGTHNTRLNYDKTNISFALKNAGDGNSNYRLYRLTWSTEELLAAIEEMIPYTNSNGSGIVSGVYQDFLSCLNESIALYLKFNVAHTPEQLEQTTAVQAELKAQVIRLRSYKNLLGENSYSGILENLDTPYNELVRDPISQMHSMDVRIFVDSTYYIVHHDPDGNGSTGWAWAVDDGMYEQTANNRIYGAPVEISDGRVVNGQPTWAFLLKENKSDEGTVYKKEFATRPVYESTFFVNEGPNIPNNTKPYALSYMASRQVAFVPTVYDNGFTLHCNKDFDGVSGNEKYYVQYISSLNGFRPYAPESITGETSRFHLYRISSQVLDLYKAIQQVAVYTEGGNADGRYPDAEYNDFLTCLQDSIDLYQYYNTSLHEDWDEAGLKEDLDAQADKLLAQIGYLTLADTKASYIDIPVEFLDFRADGFMLHYLAGGYGLNNVGDLTTYYGKDIANALRAFDTVTPEGSPSTVAQNLTLPELVNGNLVYTEETILMVAYNLIAGLYEQADNIPGQNQMIKAKVDALAAKAKPYTIESPEWMAILGSPTDTFNKTTTPGENGGELLLENVTTACDLAYYITNYLWRPVSTEDKFDDGYTYNVTVPERSVFRLFQDEETGLYTLDAYNRVEYSGSYICNAYPITDNEVHQTSPNFKPIDSLGFEKDGYMPNNPDTDLSQSLYNSNNYSSDGMNYHFTAHAKGSFVYYEEQNLYFEFLGDDDVYFYINGKRAMDLGGGHAAASGKLYLNSVAKALGLEDGKVYSFDMFYAERKASASNLKFSTNIQLMDPDLLTKKSQYDSNGTALLDGAAVNVGSPVTYSFELENRRDLPVRQVTFSDPTLGITMSKDQVTIDSKLSQSKLTNLTLSYRSIDPKTDTVYSGKTTSYTNYNEFKTLIEGLTNDTNNAQPFSGGCSFTVTTADQLKDLLSIGIPASCQLSVYGMVRNATSGKYVNTVTTSACPVMPDVNGNQIILTPVNGSASRSIYGINLADITIPEPLQIVLDYGKPIELPMNELWTRVKVKDKNIALTYAGLTLNGENGAVRVKEPLQMFCNSTLSGVADENYSFYLNNGTPTFRLKKLMTEEKKVFAVYRISLRNTKETIAYLMEEIQLLPATMMYYETDFAEDIFVVSSGTYSTVGTSQNELQDDGTVVPGDAFVKTGNEEKDYSKALFFDFSNNAVDQQRYRQPQYGGTDFNNIAQWTLTHMNDTISSARVDTAAGTLTFSPVKDYPRVGDDGKITVANSLNLQTSSTLAYNPAQAEILQIRFKLEGFEGYSPTTPFFRLWWGGRKNGITQKQTGYEGAELFSTSYVSDGTYMTITMDLKSEHIGKDNYNCDYTMRELDKIEYVRFAFHNFAVTADSKVTFDYMYIGPKNSAPVQHGQDSLYITFDNRDSDKLRYEYPQYGGLSPDTAGWTSMHHIPSDRDYTISPVIDNISGTISATYTKAVKTNNSIQFLLDGLDYPVAQAEVLEVRAKLENMTPIVGSARLRLWYRSEGMAQNEKKWFGPMYNIESTENGQYIYITIELDDDFRQGTNLNMMQLAFHEFEVTTASKITIDYIYMGPEADAPSKQASFYSSPKNDFLYFGFENDAEAQNRYSTSTYNGMNFDLLKSNDITCWAGNRDRSLAPVIDHGAGTMSITAQSSVAGYDSSFYVQSGPLNVAKQHLNYSPGKAEVAQVRLKFKGFKAYNNQTPSVLFRAHLNGISQELVNGVMQEVVPPATDALFLDTRILDSDRYITLSLPLNEAFTQAAVVNGLRLAFDNVTSISTDAYGTVVIDYIYIGPKDSAPDPVYGYDSSYEDDIGLSNGSSLYMEGQGVKLNENTKEYTRAEFTFTGTGFDLISRTGEQTATLRVEIHDNAGNLEKRLTVNTKGELELYQIPVVSVQGLEHDTYHVTIDVNNKVDSIIPILSRGNQFYFDAVRIYDPVDTTKNPLTEPEMNDMVAHLMDKEDRSIIKEIRNILLSADDFSVLSGSGIGALFIDSYQKPTVPVIDSETGEPATDPETGEPVTTTPEDLDINNHYAMDVLTYNKVGPKNEVYLDPGQAVAFKLQVDNSKSLSDSLLPISLDIGAKTITGKAATLVAAVVSGGSSTDSALTIATGTKVTLSTCTAMYRPLTLNRSMLTEENDKKYCYIVLYNNTDVKDEGSDTVERNADYVISLTDVKLCYVLDPTDKMEDSAGDTEIQKRSTDIIDAASTISFMVDGNTTRAAAEVIRRALETPILAEGGKVMHSLNLESDIAINYVVKKEDLTNYSRFYLDCVIPEQAEPLRIDPVEKDGYYYFTLEGLTAVQMNDPVTATLYLEKNGRIYYWQPDTYSIAQYAYTQLNKEGTRTELKTLCAELLRYGAMAQIYKGYRTDALADEAMTEEQKALLTNLSAVTFGAHNRQLSDLASPTVKWVAKSLILDSRVTLRYIADLSACEGSLEDLSLRISYKDYNGAEKTVVVTEAQPYGNVAGWYSFDFNGLLAAELRTVLHAAVYAGDTQISTTTEYSVDTYGANKTGTLGNLCKAMMAYSDSAKVFFS